MLHRTLLSSLLLVIIISILIFTFVASGIAGVQPIVCTNSVGGAPYNFYYDKVTHQMTLANNTSGIFFDSDDGLVLNFSFVNVDGTRDPCRIDRKLGALFCVDHAAWRLQGYCSFR